MGTSDSLPPRRRAPARGRPRTARASRRRARARRSRPATRDAWRRVRATSRGPPPRVPRAAGAQRRGRLEVAERLGGVVARRRQAELEPRPRAARAARRPRLEGRYSSRPSGAAAPPSSTATASASASPAPRRRPGARARLQERRTAPPRVAGVLGRARGRRAGPPPMPLYQARGSPHTHVASTRSRSGCRAARAAPRVGVVGLSARRRRRCRRPFPGKKEASTTIRDASDALLFCERVSRASEYLAVARLNNVPGACGSISRTSPAPLREGRSPLAKYGGDVVQQRRVRREVGGRRRVQSSRVHLQRVAGGVALVQGVP